MEKIFSNENIYNPFMSFLPDKNSGSSSALRSSLASDITRMSPRPNMACVEWRTIVGLFRKEDGEPIGAAARPREAPRRN